MEHTPVYTHDCGPEGGCRYLGTMTPPEQYAPEGVEVVDLWVHVYKDDHYSGSTIAPTEQRMSLIYRYADDGPEYESIPYRPGDPSNPFYVLSTHPVFAEILRRLTAQ